MSQFRKGDTVRLTRAMGPDFPAGDIFKVTSVRGETVEITHADGRSITSNVGAWRFELVESAKPFYIEFWRITLLFVAVIGAVVLQLLGVL